MAGWAGYRIVAKLKKLKLLIREWAVHQFRSMDHYMACLLQEIQEIDKKEELGKLSSEEFLKRLQLKNSYQKMVKGEEIKWIQRSRVKWIMNWDTNSKIFYSFASFRKMTNKIVILRDGDRCIEDENRISDHIIQFFKALYSKDSWIQPTLDNLPFNVLGFDVEKEFFEEEIKVAVFELGMIGLLV